MPQFINSSRNVNMDPPTHARPYTEQERRAKIQFLNVFLATIEVECAILAELEKKKTSRSANKKKDQTPKVVHKGMDTRKGAAWTLSYPSTTV